MRNLGMLAFGITTAVLAPTIVHVLDAGPNQVAKLVAPGNRTITINGAKLAVSVDRAFVDSGAKVHLTVTGTAPTAQRVAVEVLVYESTGTSGGRIETPPNRIMRETLTLDIKDGAPATRQLAIALPGARGEDMESLAPFGHYTILVMPPKDAETLDRMRRRADRGENPMSDPTDGTFNDAFRTAGKALEPGSIDDDGAPPPFARPGEIARIDVNTRAANSPVAVQAADTGLVGYDLPVAVKVRNPSSHPVPDVTVTLATHSDMIEGDYLGLADDHVTIDSDKQVISLAGHETKSVTFHVRVDAVGTLGLYATARCDDCYQIKGAMAINDAALDAVDIVAAPEQTPTVVIK